MAITMHKITVKIDWETLWKDVQDKAYRMARLNKLAITDDAAAEKFESEVQLTDSDNDLLRRAMTQGLAEIVTMCRDYLWGDYHGSDNYLVRAGDITLVLMMPSNYNLAVGSEALGQLMHAYMVGKGLLEWFRYTAPSRFAEQQALCEEARNELRKALNSRQRLKANAGEVIIKDGGMSDMPSVESPTVYVEKNQTYIASGSTVNFTAVVRTLVPSEGAYSSLEGFGVNLKSLTPSEANLVVTPVQDSGDLTTWNVHIQGTLPDDTDTTKVNLSVDYGLALYWDLTVVIVH